MQDARTRWWDLPAVVLLILALLISAARLTSSGWTTNLGPVGILTFLGAILGLALGFSRFRGEIAGLLAFFYGAILIPWSFAEYLYPRIVWLDRVELLAGRLVNSITLLINQQPVDDTLLFSFLSAIVYWCLSLCAGFFLIRRAHFLAAVLPAGIVMFIVQLFNSTPSQRIGFLLAYLFFSLLLFGRLNYVRKRRIWKEQNFFQPYDAGTILNSTILIASLLFVFALWLIPQPDRSLMAVQKIWDRIIEPWEKTIKEMGNITAGLQGDTGGVSGYGFYGSTLSLGKNAPTDATLLFRIKVPGTLNYLRDYWRVRTYDTYQDGHWITSFERTQNFLPEDDPFNMADAGAWEKGEFIIEIMSKKVSSLITPSHPIWINRPVIVTISTGMHDFVEPLMFRTASPLEAGDQYRIRAVLSNPTVFQLRAAGTEYPGWVIDHYLHLPGELPGRIHDLAIELTEGKETPYDKTLAITIYLRQQMHYSKTIPEVPAGSDVVDWFLFEQKKGFCSYYASAEVILLRSVGIPARMVVGFSQGSYNYPNIRLVHVKDAHAWPEVYFPGIGWVEFEPTSAEPPLSRPLGGGQEIGDASNGQQGVNFESEADLPVVDAGETTANLVPGEVAAASRKSMFQPVMIGIMVSVLALGGIYFWVTYKPRVDLSPIPIFAVKIMESSGLAAPPWLSRWVFLASQSPIVRTFEVVFRSLRWLGHTAPAANTPAQSAGALSVLMPEAAQDIQTLLDAYQKTVYSQQQAVYAVTLHAAEAVRKYAVRAVLRMHWVELRNWFLSLFKGKKHEG